MCSLATEVVWGFALDLLYIKTLMLSSKSVKNEFSAKCDRESKNTVLKKFTNIYSLISVLGWKNKKIIQRKEAHLSKMCGWVAAFPGRMPVTPPHGENEMGNLIDEFSFCFIITSKL